MTDNAPPLAENTLASFFSSPLCSTPTKTPTLELVNVLREFIEDDEFVDVTPSAIRVRKKILKEVDRKRMRSTK